MLEASTADYLIVIVFGIITLILAYRLQTHNQVQRPQVQHNQSQGENREAGGEGMSHYDLSLAKMESNPCEYIGLWRALE